MFFIELTNEEGTKLCVNMELVTEFHGYGEVTILSYATTNPERECQSYSRVRETRQQIINMIPAALRNIEGIKC